MVIPTGQADNIILDRLRLNDQTALTRLMELHYQSLFRYGARLYPDEALIRDCIQEVFIAIWERRAKLPIIKSFRAYLIKALRNRIRLELRQNRLQNSEPLWNDEHHFRAEYTVDPAFLSEEEQSQQLQKLELLLNALPSRQKEIIHLRFYQNLSHEQIAEIMAMNRQSVYNLLHETLRKLRNHWELPLLLFWLSRLA